MPQSPSAVGEDVLLLTGRVDVLLKPRRKVFAVSELAMPRKKQPKAPSEGEIEAGILNVKRVHALGLEVDRFMISRKRDDDTTGHGENLIGQARMSCKNGLDILTSDEKARKVRQFAKARPTENPIGYTAADIEAFAELARQKKHVLRATSLIRLLRIRSHKKRCRLTEQMIRNNWSVTEVTNEISRKRSDEATVDERRAVRRNAGKRLRPPTSERQVSDEFANLATRWINYLDLVESNHQSFLNKLPDNQVKALRKVAASIRNTCDELGCDPEAIKRYAQVNEVT